MIMRCDGCAVDCLSVLPKPLPYCMQTVCGLGIDESFGRGTYAKHQVAALRYDLDECGYDFAGSLVTGVAGISPVVGQGDATLPGIGQLLLRETAPGGALALKSRKFEPYLGGDFALTVTFEAQDGEQIYGMGQYQEETLDWKGATLELAHRNSQASVPFYISSLGYGFLWHNPAIGEVSFGTNRTTWRAESTRQMDYWITVGDTPAEISRNYARATGFPPEMPEYGLGFWQCKLRYWNQEQLLEVAREYKRRGLPVDVIVCDFFHWPKMGDYRFDPEFFPDPKAMIQELNSMGITLMVSVWPQVSRTSENYAEMQQQGLLVRAEYGEQIGMRFVEDNMFYDATNPRARKYVWEKCKKNYWDAGSGSSGSTKRSRNTAPTISKTIGTLWEAICGSAISIPSIMPAASMRA